MKDRSYPLGGVGCLQEVEGGIEANCHTVTCDSPSCKPIRISAGADCWKCTRLGKGGGTICYLRSGEQLPRALGERFGNCEAIKCADERSLCLGIKEEEYTPKVVEFTPNVGIPGTSFRKGEKITIVPSLLPTYIAGIFKLVVWIAVLLSVLVIMIGGYRWITAAGSQERVGGAQKMIGGAISGLLLALISYFILGTINPKLVNLEGIKPPPVERIALDDPHVYDENAEGKAKCSHPEKRENIAGFGMAGVSHLGELNCWAQVKPRAPDQIKRIVLHDGCQAGKSPSCELVTWKQKGLSSHYVIFEDGSIEQYVDQHYAGAHAGSMNADSIGVDLRPQPGGGFTDNQYNTLDALIAYIGNTTAVRRNDMQIVGHCQGSSDRSDPSGFVWNRIGLNSDSHSCLSR